GHPGGGPPHRRHRGRRQPRRGLPLRRHRPAHPRGALSPSMAVGDLVATLPGGAAMPRAARAAGRRVPWGPAAIVAGCVLAALLADVVSPADPYAQSLRARFTPPAWQAGGTWQHALGTDRLGRDMLARIVFGARVSLAAGVVTVLFAGLIGAVVGLTAGHPGGRVDTRLLRGTRPPPSLPITPLALIPAGTLGPSLPH